MPDFAAPYTAIEAGLMAGSIFTVLAFPILVLAYRMGWVWHTAEDTARRAGQLLGFGLMGAITILFVVQSTAHALHELGSFAVSSLPVLAVAAMAAWLGFRPFPYFIGRTAQERPVSLAFLVCATVWVFFMAMSVLAHLNRPLS